MLLLSSAESLQHHFFSFFSALRVSNSLDPDPDQHSVRPDLGANCLHRLSADDKLTVTLCLLVAYDHNLCKQIGPICLTPDGIPERIFSKKVD